MSHDVGGLDGITLGTCRSGNTTTGAVNVTETSGNRGGIAATGTATGAPLARGMIGSKREGLVLMCCIR